MSKHTLYILTSKDEVYIMVRKAQFTLAYLEELAFSNNFHFEKKSAVLSRFIRENHQTLSLEKVKIPVTLDTLKDVLDYRMKIMREYEEDGYFVLDEKIDKIMEEPADTNFGEVLSRINIQEAIKKFGKEALLAARKQYSVGEFVEAFG